MSWAALLLAAAMLIGADARPRVTGWVDDRRAAASVDAVRCE